MEMDRKRTACLTGHRRLPKYNIQVICKRLKAEMEILIAQGVEIFCAGGALGFDSISASMVLALKEDYPHIKLVLALPCPDQAKYWKQPEIDFYNDMLKEADEVIYTSDHYFSGCMHVRNRWLVDHSSYCICYLTKTDGGTFYTVGYAEKHGLTVINVANDRNKSDTI